MAERRRMVIPQEKKRDEEMFRWFEEDGLEFLKQRGGDGAVISYTTDEDGIDVTIKLKKILILPDFDQDLLQLLAKAGTCSIRAKDQGWMEIRLWFRGWIWVEKETTD